VAFIRYKGPYAYLVENERQREGRASRVRQRVLYYLGRRPRIDAEVIAEVERRFPDVRVDWPALRRALAQGSAPPARASSPARRRREREEEWLDWD
jgi:hypothetical protein